MDETFTGAIDQALSRAKSMGMSSKLTKITVAVMVGGAWRMTGSFSGHEFVYWVHPVSKTIIPEKDPMKELGQKAVETAQQALQRGDWEVALDAARETLALDPHHSEARAVARRWRRKLTQETLLTGVAAGTLGGALAVLPILTQDKGLHKTGPALFLLVLCLAAGLGTGAALLPLARHLFPTKKRLAVLAGASLAGVLLLVVVLRVFLGWNPVRWADQRAFDAEFKTKFPSGVSSVYHAPDLDQLQSMHRNYENSQANLTELNNHIESQTKLKRDFDALTAEYTQKLDKILGASLFLTDQRDQLVELKDYYELRGVDVSRTVAAITEIDAKIAKTATPGRTRTRGKISIEPIGGSSTKAAPVGKPKTSAPVKPAAKKSAPVKAPAKAVAKPAAKPAAKKKVKPIKIAEEKAKKKKKGIFSGSSTVD